MMPEMDGLELAGRVWNDRAIPPIPIVVLTSGGGNGLDQQFRAVGVNAVLSKPVRQLELCHALSSLARADARKPSGSSAHSGAESSTGGIIPAREDKALQILLAEDNPVNQKVVSLMLQQRGHEVTVAENGKSAVEAYQCKPFDLVFMDIQMPEMDGFEALASIRVHERATGSHTPIIALTAHAMNGDLERCQNAGFDGYLSKPVRGVELDAALDSIESHSTSCPSTISPHGFDPSFALEQVGGDEQLLKELVELFLSRAPGQLDCVQAALERGDARAAERSVHTLRGSVSIFLTPEAMLPLQELEHLSKEGKIGEARTRMGSINSLINGILTCMSE
jgi:CheY-like chemotaxis protein